MDDREIEAHNAQARRKRNITVGLVLGGIVVLFFLMTIVRLGGHVFDG
ncbi:MAG TPA: hypothetical protein VID67_16355 [Rhizomicrobium sp.]|jgi:hypothetical protein